MDHDVFPEEEMTATADEPNEAPDSAQRWWRGRVVAVEHDSRLTRPRLWISVAGQVIQFSTDAGVSPHTGALVDVGLSDDVDRCPDGWYGRLGNRCVVASINATGPRVTDELPLMFVVSSAVREADFTSHPSQQRLR